MCGALGHKAPRCEQGAGASQKGKGVRRSPKGHGRNPLLSLPRAQALACVEEFVHRYRDEHDRKCHLDNPVVSCPGSVSIVRTCCPHAPLHEAGHALQVRALRPSRSTPPDIAAAMKGHFGLFNRDVEIPAGAPVCRFVYKRKVRKEPSVTSRDHRYCMAARGRNGTRYLIPFVGHDEAWHDEARGLCHMANHVCNPFLANVEAHVYGESVILRSTRLINAGEEIVYNYYAESTITHLEGVDVCFCLWCRGQAGEVMN